jgi:hypothetical protein
VAASQVRAERLSLQGQSRRRTGCSACLSSVPHLGCSRCSLSTPRCTNGIAPVKALCRKLEGMVTGCEAGVGHRRSNREREDAFHSSRLQLLAGDGRICVSMRSTQDHQKALPRFAPLDGWFSGSLAQVVWRRPLPYARSDAVLRLPDVFPRYLNL